MVPKADSMSKAWDLANDSDKHAEQLEEALHDEDGFVATLDAKILIWKKEIEALQKKVQKAESEEKEIQNVNQQQIDEESLVGI